MDCRDREAVVPCTSVSPLLAISTASVSKVPEGDLMVSRMLVLGVVLVVPAQSLGAPQSGCAQVSAEALTDAAAAEICAGDEVARLASAAPKDSLERTRRWRVAAEHYRRAAAVASKVTTKVRALSLLVDIHSPQHLNDPKAMEMTLRDLIELVPNDLAPVFRLAKVQEDQGAVDASEETLLAARRAQPETVEPYRMLAQFYARRVTALHAEASLKEPPQATGSPGEPDEHGAYRVGGAIRAPQRLDRPTYPPEAQAAGIKGNVVAEVVIDVAGNVTDAKVLQSIPLLDEAALQAFRNWRFAPTSINGQPVPVRMTVTTNFSLSSPRPPTTPAPPRR
jgi:TonB family protein